MTNPDITAAAQEIVAEAISASLFNKVDAEEFMDINADKLLEIRDQATAAIVALTQDAYKAGQQDEEALWKATISTMAAKKASPTEDKL